VLGLKQSSNRTSKPPAKPGGFFSPPDAPTDLEFARDTRTDDLRIHALDELSTPEEVIRELPVAAATSRTVAERVACTASCMATTTVWRW
jgi:hypothetical protein